MGKKRGASAPTSSSSSSTTIKSSSDNNIGVDGGSGSGGGGGKKKAPRSKKALSTNTEVGSTTSDPKKVIVPLTWAPLSVEQVIIPSQTKGEPTHSADIKIEVKSRVVKSLETYPSDCLFRTHQYDFTLTPTRELLEWAKIDYGFYSKIKLFTFVPNNEEFESTLEEDYDNGEWNECFSSDKRPVITDSHTEDYENGVWKIVLYWQNANVFKFKSHAKFRFEIDVYRACNDRELMKKVATKISSPFRLLSKPEVYLKGLTKKKRKANNSNEDDSNNTDCNSTTRKKIKTTTNSSTTTITTNTTTNNSNTNTTSNTSNTTSNTSNTTNTLNITIDDGLRVMEESREEILLEEGVSSPILTGFKPSNFNVSDDIESAQSPILLAPNHSSSSHFNNEDSSIQSTPPPPPFLTPTSPEVSRLSSGYYQNIGSSSCNSSGGGGGGGGIGGITFSSQESGLFNMLDGPASQEKDLLNTSNTSDLFFKDEAAPSSSLGSLFSSQ